MTSSWLDVPLVVAVLDPTHVSPVTRTLYSDAADARLSSCQLAINCSGNWRGYLIQPDTWIEVLEPISSLIVINLRPSAADRPYKLRTTSTLEALHTKWCAVSVQ